MKSRLITSAAEKTYVVVFDEGDEPMRGLLQFAGQERLCASRFTSIGGFSEVTIGYFDLEKKDYIPIRLREQVEVVSLTGNIALDDGKPKVHAHVVVAKRDGTHGWASPQGPRAPHVVGAAGGISGGFDAHN